jgi:ABC-type bacteriocin/lantibiotic exporter with double-glycine peptidase domain
MRSTTSTPPAAPPTLAQTLRHFSRLVALLRPHWRVMANGLVMGALIAVVGLASPYVTKLFIDNVYPTRDVSLMHLLVLGVAASTMFAAIGGALRAYYTQVVTTRINSAVNLMFFSHVLHLPLKFFDEHRVGEITTRFGDMRSALGTVSRVFQTLLLNGIYLVVVPPMLILLNWRLTAVALMAVPLTVAITAATSRLVRRYMKLGAEASAELGAIQVEALSQIRALKPMGMEYAVFRDARAQTEEAMQTQLKAAWIGMLVGIANSTARVIGTGVFTWYAWTLILRGDLTLGGFIAFSAYIGYMTGPVGALAGLFTDFQQMSVSFGRAFEYLDMKPELDPTTAYRDPGPVIHRVQGRIALESVSFSYSADRPILQDIDAKFLPGSITAVVGTSGAGKSTLLRLICRVAEPTKGLIRVDGYAIDRFPLGEYRRQVGVVWQEPTMLRGTIWENLTFGRADAPAQSEVDEVVRACRLDSLIDGLPGGYDTPVAEWGATVSGGQRQRFAIARALLRETPILLLDEATSQVDVRTEEELWRAVLPRIRNKTVIFVTHRMATAALADRILVLDGGRIIGKGSEQELLRDNVAYRSLSNSSEADDAGYRARRVAAP